SAQFPRFFHCSWPEGMRTARSVSLSCSRSAALATISRVRRTWPSTSTCSEGIMYWSQVGAGMGAPLIDAAVRTVSSGAALRWWLPSSPRRPQVDPRPLHVLPHQLDQVLLPGLAHHGAVRAQGALQPQALA